MNNVEIQTMLLLASTATACCIPGVFLVLRRLAMLSDAMGHVLLFGIVIAYLLVGQLDSIWLYVGAAGSAFLVVVLIEQLQQTRKLKEDAALGLVFPALFSVGVLLSSIYFRNTHLDVDQVLLGHIEFAGPGAVWPQFGLACGNLALILLFYKEWKLSTFDATQAALLGFLPGCLHYGLMLMTSITLVASFDAVGPILVAAFVVLPCLTARLFVQRLSRLIMMSVLVAIVGAILGVRLAFYVGTNTAGMAALTLGVLYLFAWLVSPRRGLISQVLHARSLRRAWQNRLQQRLS